jgi:hypothetical protein
MQHTRGRAGWQRRTLPHSYPCSTIRAGELNDRVRDVSGWTLAAPATNPPCFLFCASPRFISRAGVSHTYFTRELTFTSTTSRIHHASVAWGVLASSDHFPTATHFQSPYKRSTISTAELHTLLRFHLPPIKLVVFERSYPFYRLRVSS